MANTPPHNPMKLVTDDASQSGDGAAGRIGENRTGNHHDVQRLATRIKHLHHTLLDLSMEQDFEVLLGLIRRPGYTTVAGFKLVEGLVESMHEQANTLAGLKRLVTAASYTIVGD